MRQVKHRFQPHQKRVQRRLHPPAGRNGPAQLASKPRKRGKIGEKRDAKTRCGRRAKIVRKETTATRIRRLLNTTRTGIFS